MKNNGALVFWVCVLVLGTAGYGAFYAFRHLSPAHAADVSKENETAGGTVERFTLQDQDGRDYDSQALNGKVWVASFFFTSCPQICVQLNQTLAKLQENPRYADVKFASITCNPEYDKPVVLGEYAKKFNADHKRWVFLTGTLAEITKIGEQFKVTVGKEVHSDRVILVDRKGEIRGRFRATQPDQLELIQKTLLTLLREEAPAPGK